MLHSFGNRQEGVADSSGGADNGSRLHELDVALGQGSATPGYCRRGRAAAERSHLRRSHEGYRHSEALQGQGRGRLLQQRAQDASDGSASD